MKIITPGVLPKDKTYRTTCKHCGCVFEFKREDGSYTSDQHDGESLVVECPTLGCGKECWVTP